MAAELEKAQEWHGVERIKNAKLFFRNWLAKVKSDDFELGSGNGSG